MVVVDPTIKELVASKLKLQHICIVYPNFEVGFELKSILIYLLLIFRDLATKDPNKHLKKFYIISSNMKPMGITKNQVKFIAFPFSLVDIAKEWLYYLPYGFITT